MIKQILIALDQLINAILGGWADETLSSRAHRTSPVLERVINAIFFWEKSHCYQSYLSERERLQQPPELRI